MLNFRTRHLHMQVRANLHLVTVGHSTQLTRNCCQQSRALCKVWWGLQAKPVQEVEIS